VNLAQVAERVARLLDFEVRELGVKVQVRCEGGAAWALANATQVAQILSNLLRNSLEAIAESQRGSGEVRFEIDGYEPGWVAVRVSDDGKGISPDQIEAVFAPFYTTKRDGTGLGLAVCRRLVESYGGRIWLEPAAEGASFRFTLPHAEAPDPGH
jgi:two-component system sensor kinase FixL